MLPIDYLRQLQGGGGPAVGIGASSAGPLAEILTRALPDAGIQTGGGLRRALPNPVPGLRRATPEIGIQTPDGGMRRVTSSSGNPYLDERLQPGAGAGWADPGGEIPLPGGGSITMPEGGLSQAEIDVLSGIRAGTQVAPGNETIVQSLMERGVLAPPGAAGGRGPAALPGFTPSGYADAIGALGMVKGGPAPADVDPGNRRPGGVTLGGGQPPGGGQTSVADMGVGGAMHRATGAPTLTGDAMNRAGVTLGAGQQGMGGALGSARGDFMSALRGREAPIQSDVMPKERAVPGGGQVVPPRRRATPSPGPSTPRVGAPRPPAAPRRATPQPAPGGVIQGPRPVLTARPLPLADPRRATAIPFQGINRRRSAVGRGVDKQLMPNRRAGQTDRLMGVR